MINFLLLMAIPVLVAIVTLFVFKRKIVWWEFLLQVLIPGLVIAGLLACFSGEKTSDIEHWNSQINARVREKVSCSHSYSCNCRTEGSGKNAHTVCDTCYEHAYDVDWFVTTTSGERADIDREDRQGLVMPERWKKAYIGEPFTSVHTYTNYILANPQTVLLGGTVDQSKFGGLIPAYPNVYDIYHSDHFIATGNLPMDRKTWNWLMAELNKDLGPAKQVNVLMVVAKTADPNYAIALKNAWVGGKKNDVVIAVGSLDGHKIEWAQVISWTPAENLKVELRDKILQIGSLDQRDSITQTIDSQVRKKFVRMHMKKYQYLMSSIEFSTSQMVWCLILALVLQAGFTWWAVQNDEVLEEDGPRYGRGRFSPSFRYDPPRFNNRYNNRYR